MVSAREACFRDRDGRLQAVFERRRANAEDDHGNDRDHATLVAPTGTVSGRFEEPSDQDFIRFATQEAGTWTLLTEGDSDTICVLYDEAGEQLRQNDDGGQGFKTVALSTSSSRSRSTRSPFVPTKPTRPVRIGFNCLARPATFKVLRFDDGENFQCGGGPFGPT